MALTDESGNGMVMPVAPMYGGGNNGGFGGGWGGDLGWIILLLLLAGNNGWGFGGGFGGGAADGAMLYPWMNQAEVTTGGFQNAALAGQLNGISSGVQNLSTQLCNCCADMSQTVTSGFANAETAANARQIANMNQAFNAQTAMMQGFNSLGSQFADCCCENRLGLANLNSTILSENCADRAALSDGIRDVITNQTANTQRILDKMCQQEIEAKNDLIGQLRQEVLFARGQASQIAQNEQIVNSIYNRLDQCPVGTTPVYGRTPIFQCNSNNGCGCGCNGAF